MRKIILFNLITLDGYFEGPNKWDIDWHRVDDEFNQFSIEQLGQADGLIFGRVTYQGMASYWSTADALKDDTAVAARMNAIRKYVFSRTLDQVEWNNSVLVKGDAVKELQKLKGQPGKDLLIFGSGNLAATFTSHQLIDEYRLIVNPVVLGRGNPLFSQNIGPLKFRLNNTRVFHNGNILLSYQLVDQ
jgi:dihydrofolate reductase